MTQLIDLDYYPLKLTLDILLEDKTTEKNIIWATDSYTEYGKSYGFYDEIKPRSLTDDFMIEPRISKLKDQRAYRTKMKAEVFTPSWIVDKMIDFVDADFYANSRDWKDYVSKKDLEITCGEAPFLVSRYDTTTGGVISDLSNRIGILDRKLKLVSENTISPRDWIKWALTAVKSTYGYEYQGDSLLIARINVFLTFIEYYENKWNDPLADEIYIKLAHIIAHNIWQMDGLNGQVLKDGAKDSFVELNFLLMDDLEENNPQYVKIYDWENETYINFWDFIETETKFFAYAFGNPPYNDFNNLNSRKEPLYNKFMDLTYKLATCSVLIHPARFLFNAGQTPKIWNDKILNDRNFRILYYEEDSSQIFKDLQTIITAGIVISMKNHKENYDPIKIFSPNPNLNSILKKVLAKETDFLIDIVSPRGMYRASDNLFAAIPGSRERLRKGTVNMITTNFFDTIPEAITDPNSILNLSDYVKILRRVKNDREFLYVKKDFVKENDYLYTYNLALPKINGSGRFGEKLSKTEILEPGMGATDTFINIGTFESLDEVINLDKYLHTKFMRAMLSVNKVTQDNPRNTFKVVPRLDFSNDSGINWTTNISDIGQQLYKKYDLDKAEIDFIEKNVEAMDYEQKFL